MPGSIIHFPTEEEQQATLDEFAREMRRVKERKESVPPDKLNEALERITDYLKTGWSTGDWAASSPIRLVALERLSSQQSLRPQLGPRRQAHRRGDCRLQRSDGGRIE